MAKSLEPGYTIKKKKFRVQNNDAWISQIKLILVISKK